MKEMMDKLSLKLMDKHLVTDHIVLTVGYDMESLEIRKRFGSNAVVRGMNLEEGATALQRLAEVMARDRMKE